MALRMYRRLGRFWKAVSAALSAFIAIAAILWLTSDSGSLRQPSTTSVAIRAPTDSHSNRNDHETPTSPSAGGFLGIEPGFLVRRDALGLVEESTQTLGGMLRRVKTLASEFATLAVKHGLEMPSDPEDAPFGNLTESVESKSLDDSQRMEAIAYELEELKRELREEILLTFSRPSAILELLKNIAETPNGLERWFWSEKLVGWLRLGPFEAKFPQESGAIAVRGTYHHAVTSTLESWLDLRGPLSDMAAMLLAHNLWGAMSEEETATANRVGVKMLASLDSEDEPELRKWADDFFQRNLTPQLEEKIRAEILSPSSERALLLRAHILASLLNAERAELLMDSFAQLSSPENRSSLLSAFGAQVENLQRSQTRDARFADLLSRLDALALTSGTNPSAFTPDLVAWYFVQRLKSLPSSDESTRGTMMDALGRLAEAAQDPEQKRRVCGNTASLHCPEIVPLVERFARDPDAEVAKYAMFKLADLARWGVAGTDEALARQLRAGARETVRTVLEWLENGAIRWDPGPQSHDVLRRLASEDPSPDLKALGERILRRSR
jgi:hypothetical protein